jgi:hypothetical protein
MFDSYPKVNDPVAPPFLGVAGQKEEYVNADFLATLLQGSRKNAENQLS